MLHVADPCTLLRSTSAPSCSFPPSLLTAAPPAAPPLHAPPAAPLAGGQAAAHRCSTCSPPAAHRCSTVAPPAAHCCSTVAPLAAPTAAHCCSTCISTYSSTAAPPAAHLALILCCLNSPFVPPHSQPIFQISIVVVVTHVQRHRIPFVALQLQSHHESHRAASLLYPAAPSPQLHCISPVASQPQLHLSAYRCSTSAPPVLTVAPPAAAPLWQVVLVMLLITCSSSPMLLPAMVVTVPNLSTFLMR